MAPIGDILALNEDAAFFLLGEDATYTPSGGDPVAIKVMPIRPDEIVEFGETEVIAETAIFEVRVSEVAHPQEGESIVFDGNPYEINGKPTRNERRRLWRIETVPP